MSTARCARPRKAAPRVCRWRNIAGFRHLYRQHGPRRVVFRVSRRPRAGSAPARTVLGCSHRLSSTQRAIGRRQAPVREYSPYETPFRPLLPSTAYALTAARHVREFGTTRQQLAAVATAVREWALLNPVA